MIPLHAGKALWNRKGSGGREIGSAGGGGGVVGGDAHSDHNSPADDSKKMTNNSTQAGINIGSLSLPSIFSEVGGSSISTATSSDISSPNYKYVLRTDLMFRRIDSIAPRHSFTLSSPYRETAEERQ
jgi:hypothetical protein